MERGDEGVVWLEKLTACLSKQSALEGCAIALAMCSGSVAFNLNLASSDEDLFGVYLVPTFSPSFKRSVAGHSPTDYEVHELEEYLLLLEKGNPKVVEPLFASRFVWKSPAFKKLEDEAKKCVLSQHTLSQYLHYAKAQKGSDPETPPKKRYHALRLVMEAVRIGSGMGPRVWFEDGAERDLIMNFRQGKGSQEEFMEAYSKAVEQATSLKDKLPPTTNVNQLEELLVSARLDYLRPPTDSKAFDEFIGRETGDKELRDRAIGLLEKAGLKGCRIIYVGLSGARLYGVETGNEDDFVGVFVAPLQNVLGFARNRVARVDADGSTQTFVSCKNVSHGRGMVLFELTHFSGLFSSGNHRFLEQMFLKPAQRYECEWWTVLAQKLELFLGKQAIEHFFGCCKGLVNAPGRARLAQRFLHLCEVIILENRWPVEGLAEQERFRINEMDANQKMTDLFVKRMNELEAAKKAQPLKNTTPGRDFISEHTSKLRELQIFI